MQIQLNPDSKIYVLTPAYTATWWVELLYQLAYKIKNVLWFDNVFIKYKWEKKWKNPLNKAYEKYFVKSIDTIEDDSKNVLIVPEIYAKDVFKYKHIKKVVRRLSVDNYYFHIDLPRSVYNYWILKYFNSQKYIGFNKKLLDIKYHLVQSEYAKQHIQKLWVKESYIHELWDYLNADFFNNKDATIKNRKNIVAYNPKKWYKFSKRLISFMEAQHDDVEFVPIKNMSRKQVIDLLKSSKIYIDFWHFPWKDRIPREASILWCLIMISRRWAWWYFKDFPLDDKLKIDNLKDVSDIRNKILYCIENYEKLVPWFEEYNKFIIWEEKLFDDNLKKIFHIK